jgi:hypothetical protein
MKKVFFAVSVFLFAPFLANAQLNVESASDTPVPTIIIPEAGLVPGEFLYFFDRFAEGFNFFYTFKAESKARLAIKYANERVAEINAILKEKGIDSDEVTQAKKDFDRQLSRVSSLVLEAKENGVDVSASAREFDSKFETSREMLRSVYHDYAENLKSEESLIRKDLTQVEKGENDTEKDRLEKLLNYHVEEMNKLVDEEDELSNAFGDEKEKLEASMGEQQSAESHITNAKRARIQFIAETKIQGTSTNTAVLGALASFDALLVKASESYSSKDYENAKEYAKDAKQELDDVRKEVDREDLEESFFEEGDGSSESRKMSPEEFERLKGESSPAHIGGDDSRDRE